MEIKGIITAMVTPFDQNQNLNLTATKQLVNTLIDKGINGLFILGSNGEFHVLNEEEKLKFAETVIKTANKRVPVFVGTGGNSTSQVITLSKKMETLGADALSVITPYFIVPSQAELLRHYQAIADAVSIPIVMYNIPKNTGINLEPETVTELARVKNIIAIKDSSGKLENMKKYIELTKNQAFSVITGSDSLILPAFKLGATAAIAATSNLITELDISIYKNFKAGNIEAAEKSQQSIEKLRHVLHMGTVPSVIKKAISLTGIPVGDARLPSIAPTEEIVKEIKTMLDFYKIKYR
ncbi:4-hydroxy-tetrahydrodipicolinate synthase [Anaerosinus massiliensis]|uniref:4-hydroxy-tetrahydrodipicolinate synthase n=1 Tax=Massilibacillus massiliensis TaxID=1806837 RepID=UPI000AA1F47D|nr:4-hydroxy-tetrahydrodipicolinate synthase [Massilibacillus massiliensis]